MENVIGKYKVTLVNDMVSIYSETGDLVKAIGVNANQAVQGFKAICERIKKAQA